MTLRKPRPPLSIDAALARIAGQVPDGWAGMARCVDRHERTVRKWGDADAGDDIPLSAAIQLDILYQRHGGEDFPLHEVHGHLVGVAIATRFADQFEILRRVATLAKETGDAEAALVRFALPGATEADRRLAQQELLEALKALQNMLPLLEQLPVDPEPHERSPP